MNRDWKSGPPPHVGWWLTYVERAGTEYWRWWSGEQWSTGVPTFAGMSEVMQRSARPAPWKKSQIQWCDYYPKNARVPRVDPRKQL